jgi:hypothetical protein
LALIPRHPIRTIRTIRTVITLTKAVRKTTTSMPKVMKPAADWWSVRWNSNILLPIRCLEVDDELTVQLDCDLPGYRVARWNIASELPLSS